ncbi:winged helix-turn-helix domain-containing protein [Arthrobacter sp. zg-Y750]|uniref:winged helix-turn-helix domain-containing protein n=1 Tax=Arthrobacter sp. zg-Y750 TaxID=2894189 RepID=UPI001E5612BB|nr:helix-turn-helix domain-containing protein [Arthrobacter sp. zg-Y750]MCC9177956.1 helix-turn-helix domain-containing protein [Arthrobacter sp. zg-Y750]
MDQDREPVTGKESSTAPATPGAPGEQVVSDPVHIRALAHPVRLELLAYLDDAGSATATQCATVIGESVASCSYHLRMLARHGYIEQVEQPGREKPWRPVSRHRSHVIDPAQPGSAHAVSAMAALEVERQAVRIQDWLHRSPGLPPEDLDVSTVYEARTYATHEEIRQLREEVWNLTRRFEGRWEDPGQRPEGAVPVRLFSVLNIDPGQE